MPPVLFLSGLGASMFVVRPLLEQIAEQMGEPVELVSFDSPGYGASPPPSDWEAEGVDSEIALVRSVVRGLGLRTPFLLVGASAGATTAQLYRLMFPQHVAGVVLYDPTPSCVYDAGSPMSADFNRAPQLYARMAAAAAGGALRPFVAAMGCIPGEFGDIFRQLPRGHVALFMTSQVLTKTGQHFRYWRHLMEAVQRRQAENSADAAAAAAAAAGPAAAECKGSDATPRSLSQVSEVALTVAEDGEDVADNCGAPAAVAAADAADQQQPLMHATGEEGGMDPIARIQRIRSTPLLLASAQKWDRPHGGLSHQEMRQWWDANQRPFLASSDASTLLVRADCTHTDLMLDMTVMTTALHHILSAVRQQQNSEQSNDQEELAAPVANSAPSVRREEGKE